MCIVFYTIKNNTCIAVWMYLMQLNYAHKIIKMMFDVMHILQQ